MKRSRSSSSVRRAAFGIFVGAIAWTMSSSPLAVNFTNSTSITIPTLGNASLYPSPIIVAGLPGTITSVSVTLNNYTHSFSDDVAVLLAGPGGALLLMDGVSDGAVSNATITLQDGGAAMPDVNVITTGTYKPTAYFTGDSFAAPGPGTTYNHPGPAGGNTDGAGVFCAGVDRLGAAGTPRGGCGL